MLDWIAKYLVRRSKRTPYFDLKHTDGSLYMGRWWLVPFRHEKVLTWRNPIGRLLQLLGIAIRVHHIATADLDRHLHDHPWSFISVVLHGGYIEARPYSVAPCFGHAGREATIEEARLALSVAYRRATDRHRIVHVLPETYTLFISFTYVQWWGFYTPAGKIYYRDYESVHNKESVHA